jgi:hypothetical protein
LRNALRLKFSRFSRSVARELKMEGVMRGSSVSGALVLTLATAMPAYTQTPPKPPVANSGQQASTGKHAACEASTQALKEPEKRDKMQLCLSRARIDCLKQAFDQKLLGQQRTDFFKICMGEQPTK